MSAIILSALILWMVTLFSWYLRRRFSWKICPVCIGVSGTWLLLSLGIIFGSFSSEFKLPVAMLMGGTVVGIAMQGGKIWPWAQKSIFYWELPVIIIGMPVAYFLFIRMSILAILTEILVLGLLAYFFARNNTVRPEERLDNCC